MFGLVDFYAVGTKYLPIFRVLKTVKYDLISRTAFPGPKVESCHGPNVCTLKHSPWN